MFTLKKTSYYIRLIALFGFVLSQSIAAVHAIDHEINPQHGECLIAASYNDDLGLISSEPQLALPDGGALPKEPISLISLIIAEPLQSAAIRAPPALLFS